MKKYKELYDYLKLQDEEKIEMTFNEVEELIYNKLPKSAFRHRQWWANGGHVQANAWLDAGYIVKKVNFKEQRVIFEAANVNIKTYNKLVRDRIPEIIEGEGKKCLYEVLGDFEYLVALDAKLEEEVAEYREERNIEELADMLEVIYAAALALGYTREALEEIREEKARERGVFEKKYFLRKVEE